MRLTRPGSRHQRRSDADRPGRPEQGGSRLFHQRWAAAPARSRSTPTGFTHWSSVRTACCWRPRDRSGGLFVWEAFTGREYFTLRGHTAAITDLSWRADANVLPVPARTLPSGSGKWKTAARCGTGAPHGGGVEGLQFSRDGRIASCGRDQVTRTWDGNGGQQRVFDAFPDIALRAVFTHDGSRVIAGDWTGQIRVWSAADGKLLGNLSNNPPTLAERLDQAGKELAVLQATHIKLAAALTASQAAAKNAAEKANADKAAADKSAGELAARAGARCPDESVAADDEHCKKVKSLFRAEPHTIRKAGRSTVDLALPAGSRRSAVAWPWRTFRELEGQIAGQASPNSRTARPS